MDWNPPKHIVGVCALVTNIEGEVLLVKTESRGWEPPGGHVEEGETLTQAVIREIREEAGIDATIGPLSVIHSNCSEATVVLGFNAKHVSGQLATPAETLDARWVNADDALGMIVHPTRSQRMRDMLDFSGKIIYRAFNTDPFQIVETISPY